MEIKNQKITSPTIKVIFSFCSLVISLPHVQAYDYVQKRTHPSNMGYSFQHVKHTAHQNGNEARKASIIIISSISSTLSILMSFPNVD